MDRITTVGITGGGLGVVVAVLGIFVYLLSVVIPLFRGASIAPPASFPLLAADEIPLLLFADVDEYRAVGEALLGDGRLVVFDARDGARISETRLWDGSRATAFARLERSGRFAVAFPDGSVRLGKAAPESAFLSAEDGARFAPLPKGGRTIDSGHLVERTTQGELRSTALVAALEPPLDLGAPAPVERLDLAIDGETTRVALFRTGPRLDIATATRSENPISGETTTSVEIVPLPGLDEIASLGTPAALRLTTKGDQLIAAWPSGRVVRWNLVDPSGAILAEAAELAHGAAPRLERLVFGNGEQTLLAADSAGNTTAWFRVASSSPSAGRDGNRLVPAHHFEPEKSAITAVAASRRDKCFAVGSADGSIALHHLTSENLLGRVRLPSKASVVELRIAPKGDGLFAVGADGRAVSWALSNPHPESSLRSLFGKVWYEGYPAPAHTWQSSSGADDFEPKLGLVPLVFGSLKATIYALLFALPIALAAAIYTSEFLDERWRSPVKSTVEVMASLPSVVLGFLAALVLAPLVEKWVLAVLAAFALVPMTVLGAGYLWQLLPQRAASRLGRRWQLPSAGLLALVAVAAAPGLASVLERILFGGDFKGWLDGRSGTAAPGIAVVVWPILVALLILADLRLFSPLLHRQTLAWKRPSVGAIELAKFVLLLAVSILLAALVGRIAAAAGFDARGSLVGTYVQRNALIVGFVMGFAVIPIVYTISEDALQAVPKALRSASLGCGATRWQTAIRVVLPVAIPGIFSAVMVGLGRAVGETMIVLMAAGNTPVIEMNPFSGLRTLSANIAVELPEAVKDGTLYRTLFLAALLLFAVTFLLNTAAEIVRQRFRKRTAQL